MWLTTLITVDDPRWKLVDLICSSDCTHAAYEYAIAQLSDPDSRTRSIQDIKDDVQRFNTEYITSLLTAAGKQAVSITDSSMDPVLQCEPVGFFNQIKAPLPLQIVEKHTQIIFQQEYFNTLRSIELNADVQPRGSADSRMGYSVGWFDGPTLVVVTTNMQPGWIGATDDALLMDNSDYAIGIERYTRSESGDRLDLELTIVDPVLFQRPLLFHKAWILYPDVELQHFECEPPSAAHE